MTCCKNTHCPSLSFQNNHWVLPCWFVFKDFPLGVWKVSKVLDIGRIFIFVWSKRFFADAACSVSFPALTFKRLFVSCGCFFSNSCVQSTLCSLSKISLKRRFHLLVNKVDRSRFSVISRTSFSWHKGFSTPMGFLRWPDPLDISLGGRISLGFSACWWIWVGFLLDVSIVGTFLV